MKLIIHRKDRFYAGLFVDKNKSAIFVIYNLW